MLTTKQGENPYICKNSNAWFNCFKTSKFVQIIIIKNKMSIEKVLHYSCTSLYFKSFTSCCRSHLNVCKAFALYHSQSPVRSNSFPKVAKKSPPIFAFGTRGSQSWYFEELPQTHSTVSWYGDVHTTSEGHSVWMNPCNCFHNRPKTTTVTVISIR